MDIPIFPKTLPGTFWGICAYYNPTLSKNLFKNYHLFRASSKKQGLNLLTVELAFRNRPFELNKDDTDILIQVRADSILWQKERLLNIGLDNLPHDCDKVAWIDADIIFTNNHWINDASILLEKYNVVQLFDYVIRLNKSQKPDDPSKFKEGFRDGEKSKGIVYARIVSDPKNRRPGLAWAARREILEGLGFFDKWIVGSADYIFYSAMYESTISNEIRSHVILSTKTEPEVANWITKMHQRCRGSVYFVKGEIFHLYHGSIENRQYDERVKMLRSLDFDPSSDIKLNSDGCWEWASDRPRLHKFLENYFYNRNPDDKMVLRFILLIKKYYRGAISQIKRYYRGGLRRLKNLSETC